MDHSILVLNAQAMREGAMLGADITSPAVRTVHQNTAKVATRTLEIVIADPILNDLRLGFHNNQFIMICHAVAELVQVSRAVTTRLRAQSDPRSIVVHST